MITKAAQIASEATRARWSTVILLTLIFTSMRAVVDWGIIYSDVQLFFVKLFATLIISLIISFVVHVMLYVIFSPKPVAVTGVFEKPLDEAVTSMTAAVVRAQAKKRVKTVAKKSAKKSKRR